jgi:hypothetical protein
MGELSRLSVRIAEREHRKKILQKAKSMAVITMIESKIYIRTPPYRLTCR